MPRSGRERTYSQAVQQIGGTSFAPTCSPAESPYDMANDEVDSVGCYLQKLAYN
jgi:hypothetical protein